MARFLVSVFYISVLFSVYLSWSRQQVDRQINKMQEAAFNTPGAEAPITPPVVLGGMILLGSHLLVSRGLRLKGWQAFLSLIVGGAIGVLGFLLHSTEEH